MNATISDSPTIVTFYDVVDIPSRHELEAVLLSISTLNNKLKALDREVGLSKLYISKSSTKPGQVSPIEGESDIRWKLRDAEQGKKGNRSGGKGNQFDGGGSKFLNIANNDKMED